MSINVGIVKRNSSAAHCAGKETHSTLWASLSVKSDNQPVMLKCRTWANVEEKARCVYVYEHSVAFAPSYFSVHVQANSSSLPLCV